MDRSRPFERHDLVKRITALEANRSELLARAERAEAVVAARPDPSTVEELREKIIELFGSPDEALLHAFLEYAWSETARIAGWEMAARWQAEDEVERLRAEVAEASDALCAVGKAALSVAPTLCKPYRDAPDTSPWEQFMEQPARRAYELGARIRRELKESPVTTPSDPTTAPVTAEDLRERLTARLESEPLFGVAEIVDVVLDELDGDPGDLPTRMTTALRGHSLVTGGQPYGASTCRCERWTGRLQDWTGHLAEVAMSVRWEDNAHTKAENEQLRAAVTHVQGIHRKSLFVAPNGPDRGKHYCMSCTFSASDWTYYEPYPCATARAVEPSEALGGEA